MATTKTPAEILEAVIHDGRSELRRGVTGLAFSGFGAGLNISFSAIALAVVGSLTGGIGLAAIAAYPIGFLIVVLGRAELFTENTVTPVAVVLTDRTKLLNMLRLWAVIFVFNILGAIAFAFVFAYGRILSSSAIDILLGEVATKLEAGFWEVTLKAVIGGWLVALIAWMVAASQDTISQIFFIWLLVLLIPATGLAHCVAGSAEVLMSVFLGEASWAEYFGRFLVPATLGNVVGGLVLVTLLNYGQVVGSRVKKSQ
jgi:formate/nitrite transporter FocA (FNT family)